MRFAPPTRPFLDAQKGDDVGPELTVPPIFSPIPPAIHPSHAAIDAQTTAWAQAIGIGSDELRGRLVQHDIGSFAARVLPDGRESVVGILSTSSSGCSGWTTATARKVNWAPVLVS